MKNWLLTFLDSKSHSEFLSVRFIAKMIDVLTFKLQQNDEAFSAVPVKLLTLFTEETLQARQVYPYKHNEIFFIAAWLK